MTKYFDERDSIGYQPPDIIEGGEQALLAIANMKQKEFDPTLPFIAPKQNYDLPQTNDVFGKQLLEFKQLPKHNRDSVPLVFHLLVGYFQDKPEHLKSVGLFRVAVDLQLVSELEVHIAMEDYSFI